MRPYLSLLLEFIWWLLTAILVIAVLSPIHKAMYVWPYEIWNIAFIVALVTFTRYIFLLRHTFLASRQVVKIVFLLLMFPAIAVLITGLHSFLQYIEDYTWEPLTGHLPPADKRSVETYIWNEMLFFGSGSILAAPVLAGKLFWSVWQTRNRART
jgi:hypothetical protein